MGGEEEEAGAEGAAPAGEVCPFCGAAAEAGSGIRLRPGKNRELQVVREGGRKYFDAQRKEEFLAWLALTASVQTAAERVGVCRQTVAKHRISDPEFAAAYEAAIAMAVPDLQARLIAHANGPPRLDSAGELEPPDESAFDAQLAIQIVREQKRMQGARSGTARKQGRPPSVATNAEVDAALLPLLGALEARIARKSEDGGEDAEGRGDGC
jgi:ribosomal protein L24E